MKSQRSDEHCRVSGRGHGKGRAEVGVSAYPVGNCVHAADKLNVLGLHRLEPVMCTRELKASFNCSDQTLLARSATRNSTKLEARNAWGIRPAVKRIVSGQAARCVQGLHMGDCDLEHEVGWGAAYHSKEHVEGDGEAHGLLGLRLGLLQLHSQKHTGEEIVRERCHSK